MMIQIETLLKNSSNSSLRLGQYFCNTYIKHPWPELYYEENTSKCIKLIETWLVNHQYFNELPPKLPTTF